MPLSRAGRRAIRAIHQPRMIQESLRKRITSTVDRIAAFPSHQVSLNVWVEGRAFGVKKLYSGSRDLHPLIRRKVYMILRNEEECHGEGKA